MSVSSTNQHNMCIGGNTSDLQCHFTTRRFHCTATRIVIISVASYRHTNHLLGRHIAHNIECDIEDVG